MVIFDVWKLETFYRILSFMAPGIVLLVLGFIYNKGASPGVPPLLADRHRVSALGPPSPALKGVRRFYMEASAKVSNLRF